MGEKQVEKVKKFMEDFGYSERCVSEFTCFQSWKKQGMVKGLGSVAVKRATELQARDLGSGAGSGYDMGTSVNLAGPWSQKRGLDKISSKS